jgi:hypothetical protein
MADIWNSKAENAIEKGMSTIFRKITMEARKEYR